MLSIYVSRNFNQFLNERGIQRQLTVPYTPEQNGVAERCNRTLEECARSMLQYAGLSKDTLWAEAINTAAYIKNRTATRALEGKTPYEVFYAHKPDVSNFKVFGCDAYAHIPKQKRTKFASKSMKMVFVGYDMKSKGYRLYNPRSNQTEIHRDVAFNESSFDGRIQHEIPNNDTTYEISSEGDTGSEEADEITADPQSAAVNEATEDAQSESEHETSGSTVESEDTSPIVQRKSSRVPKQTQPFPGMIPDWHGTYIPGPKAPKAKFCLCAQMENSNPELAAEPITYKQAMESPFAMQWQEAMEAEYNSLQKHKTWALTKLPKDRKVVGCKWVFRIKRKADGSVDRFKARLVAKGFTQEEGIDYDEVFSPVARYTSVRTVLALANEYDMEIEQMDVQTAFLHGDLDEEIYMSQPEGFVERGKEGLVCKLQKSLYGLKQAARCWNLKINAHLLKLGYSQNQADHCVYCKRVGESVMILALYVDDLILISDSKELIQAEKKALSQQFEIKDLGPAHFILGIQIRRDRAKRQMFLSQSTYLKKVLERFGMSECKPANVPMDAGLRANFDQENSEECDKTLFQSAIGSINYAVTATRPDLAAALGCVNSYMQSPKVVHWKGVKHILRYIRGTVDFGLTFSASPQGPKSPLLLIGYSDSDWAGCNVSRKSTSGYVFYLGSGVEGHGSAISWSSRRQSTVALSSTEAEYVSASATAQEAIWLRKLLTDLFLPQKTPCVIYVDNQGSIKLAKNQTVHGRSKHIQIKWHFVRQLVADGDICLKYVSSQENKADGFTKPLTLPLFTRFRDHTNVYP